jgi:sarcosine oxidase subunit beta
VIGAEHVGGRLVAVRTPQGTHAADLFVDATNAWSPRLGRLLGGVDLPIAPRKRYLWMCERAGSLTAAELAAMPLTIAPSGAYCRPENDASMLMGWAHEAPEEPDFSNEDQDRIEPAFWHRGGTDTLGFATWASLAEVLPALGEFGGLTATTCGYYGVTPDHNPFLGFDPQVPNLLRLAGFSGHGAMFGPFTALIGEALAEAGQDVATVRALGIDCPLGAFRIGREFHHGEHMVI